jgi:hypothetical protein
MTFSQRCVDGPRPLFDDECPDGNVCAEAHVLIAGA